MDMMKYDMLAAQMRALVEGESDETSILANAAALIKENSGWFWVGFYIVRPCIPVKPDYATSELRLGPFQGPVACYRIGYGKGVCGTSWKLKETVIVPDVEEFPGHIACSSLSRSEIVVPIFRWNGDVAGVLDIDSLEKDTFTEEDRKGLETICSILGTTLFGK